jgi:hypothetical protein
LKGGEKLLSNFDWKIWFKKWGKGLGITLITTGCIYTAEYIELTQTEMPAEYAFYVGLVAISLMQIGNYIKHKYLVD